MSKLRSVLKRYRTVLVLTVLLFTTMSLLLRDQYATDFAPHHIRNFYLNYEKTPVENISVVLQEDAYAPGVGAGANVSPVFRWCPMHHTSVSNKSVLRADLDCDALFSGNAKAVRKAKNWTAPCHYNDSEMIELTSNCDTLKMHFQFSSHPLSLEEAEFPLAFVILVEKNAEQVVRLLASIYQPQNLYCITYDQHGGRDLQAAIRNATKCFPNVLLPPEHLEIFWADFSILQATLNCMRTLHATSDHGWRYVQILSWNDVPLRTNAEMVQIFRILNGSADSELTFGQAKRFREFYAFGFVDRKMSKVKNTIPPHNLVVYKGSFSASLPRSFAAFVLEDPRANDFLHWSRGSWAPEEQFWSTLIHNSHLDLEASFPGSCLHYYNWEKTEKPWISRYQLWYLTCAGKIVSGSCAFGVGDLASLMNQTRHLVAHKVYADLQPAALYCLHQRHFMRTYRSGPVAVDRTFFENLPAVRYHNMVNKSEFRC